MKKIQLETILKASLLLILSLLLTVASATTPAEKGLEIARQADERDSGFQDYTTDMTMKLRNKQGRESIRELRNKVLEVKDDGDKSLAIFDNPKDIKGTAFLTFSHKIGDDDQFDSIGKSESLY